MGNFPNDRRSFIVQRVYVILRGGAAGLGPLLLVGLWDAFVGLAQNMSYGGHDQFSGVTLFVAVPAFEIGALVGIAVSQTRAGRSLWRIIVEIGTTSWLFVVINVLFLMLSGIY